MGRTSRWLANFLGWKKSENNAASNGDSKGKKWRFGKSYREAKGKGAQNIPAGVEERRGSYREVMDGNEESKRAIAVAAATAAVAEAAVKAAHAAAEVVKLTVVGHGRSMRAGGNGGRWEEWAVIKIQAVFRGYLARRALRALKGLVRLQALARGNIVRKQVAETLRCMHALVRVQARARTCRALKNERAPLDKPPRSNGPRSQRSASVKRGYGRNPNVQMGDHGRSKSAGWNWLDQWIEEKYSDDEKNTKILEVDPGKPSNPKQTPKQQPNKTQFTMTSSCSTLTQPESPSKDSTTAQLSMPSPSTVDMAESSYQISYEESPYYSLTSKPGSSKRGGYTPTKSEYSSSYTIFGGGYTDYYPNYMTNTKSSSAKVRSQSAPKQRPAQFEKLGSVKKVVNSNLQLKFASKGYPGSGRLDRLGMPIGY